MGRKNRKCPYCKSKVSYFGALSELQSGEHTCRNCYKNSNISFQKTIYIPAAVALLIAIAVAAMFFWFKIITNLILALVLILVPFGVFYFITPLFFILEEIKNEAQTPVMIVPKRAARAEKQSRTFKSDEVAKVEVAKVEKIKTEKVKAEKVKTEKKSSDTKKKSGGGKFSQFVRTYIILPDDDEEIDNKADKNNTEPKINNKPDSDFIIEESIEPEITNVTETEEIVSEINDETTEKNVSENITPIEVKADDKPKLNFNKLFSKLNFSDNKKTELPVSEHNSYNADVKSEISENLNGPVYHRLTKTNKVSFIYYPDKKAIISVHLSVPDNTAEEINPENVKSDTVVEELKNEAIETIVDEPKTEIVETVVDETETVEIAAEESNNEVTEAIEMVVEKAIEAEKNEEENREVVNFFADKNNEQVDENISEIQSVDIHTENVTDDVPETVDEDWVDYSPEKGEFIALSFSEHKKSDTDNIIGLSDVNFDIAESEEIPHDNIETKDSFVDYEFEDKLPVIVVEDSKKKLSELDSKLFEKNPTKFEWNVFSAEPRELGLKPEKANFDVGNLIDPVVNDEIDYKSEYEIFSQDISDEIPNEKDLSENIEIPADNKGETKEKHKFGLFSKYVSKIKNESVFNFEKSGKSNKNFDEKPEEILEFSDNLPNEEIKVDEIIEFSSNLETDENNDNEVVEEFSEADNSETLSEATEIEPENISVEDNNISPETEFEMDYETVASDVVNVESESVEISEKEVEDEEIGIFKPEEFMYGEFSNKEISAEDEPVNVEENEDYYKFDEDDDDVPEIEDEEFSEEDEDYYKFNEENDDVPEEENVSEEDEDYYKFNEENDDIPEEENVSEEDEDYFRFDEEDDDDSVLVTETVEGAIEYIPEEKNEDSFVVDYSMDKSDEFEDISSGEQLDQNFNLEEFRAKSTEKNPIKETVNAEPIIPVKIDSSGNRIDKSEKPSHYEKKFPNAAKAAAEQAAVSELKNKKDQQKAKAANKTKKKKSDSDSAKPKDVQKKETPKPKETTKAQEQKTGFFSGLKNKIIEATEEERQAAFEEEERERKLAEREARRKAKEKDKEKAEKLKVQAEKEKTNSNAVVNAAKESSEKLENRAKADVEERKKKSQKTKRIEKNKVKIPSNVPADGKTIVFENSEKTVTKEYEVQEKIVLDSVKDKVKELENKKVTEAEKVKIISEKVDEEKRQEKIEKLKTEQEEQRVRKEKKRKEKQLQNERLEKAEEIRREQIKQVRKNQNARKKLEEQLEEKRAPGSVSLKEVNNVRSKVSQKKKKREQEADELL